tara:strand:- start:135 stop:560 length:426 start_codon:yes stop_codon:yes gene_type:complete
MTENDVNGVDPGDFFTAAQAKGMVDSLPEVGGAYSLVVRIEYHHPLWFGQGRVVVYDMDQACYGHFMGQDPANGGLDDIANRVIEDALRERHGRDYKGHSVTSHFEVSGEPTVPTGRFKSFKRVGPTTGELYLEGIVEVRD